MPGVVAHTATTGFVNAALPYILDIVNLGVENAIKSNSAIEPGVATFRGELRHLSLFVR